MAPAFCDASDEGDPDAMLPTARPPCSLGATSGLRSTALTFSAAASLAVIGLLLTTPVAKADVENQEPTGTGQQAIFGFGGVITREDMWKSAALIPVDYEKNYVIGGGYQLFPYEISGVKLGVEAGIAARFGEGFTGEVWGGGVIRYDQIRIGDNLFLSPAFTAGLSFVNKAHPGREANEEREDQGNARALFYLGPEINLAFSEDSKTEFFWRLHHRSGGWRTLGNMKGATNANVFGVRYKF